MQCKACAPKGKVDPDPEAVLAIDFEDMKEVMGARAKKVVKDCSAPSYSDFSKENVLLEHVCVT